MKKSEILSHFSEQGKCISIVGSVKSIENTLIQVAIALSSVTCLKFFRIKEDYVIASSEKNGRELRTRPGHETAFGIHLLFDFKYNILSFHEINSPRRGFGGFMVNTVMEALPAGWTAVVVMDFSKGFWLRMKAKHCNLEIL